MKKILLLMVATFWSKIIAFVKELSLAYYYGTSDISDIYLIALTIPVALFGIFSAGISSSFIPAYKKAVGDKNNTVEGNEFTNEIIVVLIIGATLLIAVCFFLNDVIVDFFAKGFDSSKKEMTVAFSNIMVFAILFSCITTVMSSFLQSKEKSPVVGFLSIPLNIVLVVSISLSVSYNNIFILPYGYLIACAFQTVVFVLIARYYGYSILGKINLNNDNVRFFLSSVFALTIGSSAIQLNVLVDKMLASTVSVGGVASLEYGHRILDLISGLFIVSISTVQFPKLVNNNGNIEKVSECFHESIKTLIVFLVPMSFALVVFSKDIITVVYARGAFGSESIELTSSILVFYGIGLIAIGVREIVSKLYYALGNVSTPVINSIIGVIINIILSFILVNYFGVGGIAFATSISAVVITVALLLQIKGKIAMRFRYMFYIKIILIAILSTIICKAVINHITIYAYYLNIIIGFIIFCFIYLTGIILLGIFDMKKLRNTFCK